MSVDVETKRTGVPPQTPHRLVREAKALLRARFLRPAAMLARAAVETQLRRMLASATGESTSKMAINEMALTLRQLGILGTVEVQTLRKVAEAGNKASHNLGTTAEALRLAVEIAADFVAEQEEKAKAVA